MAAEPPRAAGFAEPPRAAVREAVDRALAEDLLPLGDLSAALVDQSVITHGRLVCREAGVLAGSACVTQTYALLEGRVRVGWSLSDGAVVTPGTVLAEVQGPLPVVLTGERTALNFLRHLSGVATMTARFVEQARKASHGRTRILDTRKTTPGLRALEKAAVRAGGGYNHRANLSDAVMVKDNHLAGVSIPDAVSRARALWPGRSVHVECDRLDQLEVVIASGADRVLLDNMTPSEVAEAVALVDGRLEVEVTGGISLRTVADYARAKPDFISVGAITHSADSLDIGLDL